MVAWLVVSVVLAMLSPEGDAGAQLLGALALGTAVALTLWPLLWSASRSSAGAITTAGRRSGLVGLVIAILVILRAIDVVALPVLIFLVVGAIVVEIGFTMRH